MIQNPALQQFLTHAEQLCNFLQFKQHIPVKTYRQRLVVLLLNTYKDGLLLPEIEVDIDDESDDSSFFDQVSNIELSFGEEIGDIEYYSDTFNPFDFEDNTPVTGSVIDELVEIFGQLKIALVKIETKDQKWENDAIWTLQFHLKHTLLDEMMDVSRALHYAARNIEE